MSVLLPVHEMLGRRHLERIALNARAAMRGRAQPPPLRAQGDGAVVSVTRCVVEADQNRHAVMATLLSFSDASSRPPQGWHDTPSPTTIRLTNQLIRSNPGRPPPVSGRPRRHAAPPASGQRTPAPCRREYNH